MVELLRTNDLVLISAVRALLAEDDIHVFVADEHMSSLEGSVGFLPRRVLVPDTADAFLGGRLRLYQPSSGHRAGTDTVLLAASVPATASGLAIDVGAGVGAVGLAAALAAPGLRIALLERESALAALARANVAANRLDGRAFVAHADLLSPDFCRAAGLEPASADLVLTNPPFLSGD